MTNEKDNAAQEPKVVSGRMCEGADAFARSIADEVVRIIENKWGEAFAKLAILPQMRTAVTATRHDAAFIVGILGGECGRDDAGFESCTLKGAKRRQFMRFCEIKKSNPDYKIRRCARMALDEIRDPEGYSDIDALGEYAAMHRSWWIVREKQADSATEGGAL